VLGCPDDSAVDEVADPVQAAVGVSLALELSQHPLPHSGGLPASKAAIGLLPGAKLRREVTRWGTGAQVPKDGLDDEAVVLVRTPGGRLGGRK